MVSSEFCSEGRVVDYHRMKVSRVDTGRVLLFLPLTLWWGLQTNSRKWKEKEGLIKESTGLKLTK